MKYYYYCFLVVVGLLVLEIVAHVFTKARELNEKEEACRREKKKQGSQADTVADESADEAENKHVTSWILFFGGLILFLVGLSYGRAISAYTNDSMLDYVIMWVGMFLMILPCVYAAKKWELEAR